MMSARTVLLNENPIYVIFIYIYATNLHCQSLKPLRKIAATYSGEMQVKEENNSEIQEFVVFSKKIDF